jgi:hypothetical protein
MNPSYCRIQIPLATAVERFATWQRLPQVGPLIPTDSGNAIRLAVDEHGGWRGHAVFVSDIGEWTLFQDLSGVLGGVPGKSWAEFAGRDELVVAGYNDAVPYAELVVVRGGEVVREFLDDPSAPDQNVNRGVLDSLGEPFETWVEVAGFVDGDKLGFCERGWLWVWPRTPNKALQQTPPQV